MSRITAPLTTMVARGIRVAKSLTFGSVLLGSFLTWDVALAVKLYGIWNEKGWDTALHSNEYVWFWPVTVIVTGLFGLFYVTEVKQNTKADAVTKEILSKLDDVSGGLKAILTAINENTNVLKGISLTIPQPHNKDSDTCPENSPQDDTK